MEPTTDITLPDGTVAEVPSTEVELEILIGNLFVHPHRGRLRTIERWRDLPVFAAVRDAWAGEMQELENVFWQVFVSRFVDDAFGASLDLLGRIVGEDRQGREDADFRPWIKARIRANTSLGTLPDVIAVLDILGVAAHVWNSGNASVSVDITTLPASVGQAAQVGAILGETVAAGVRLMASVPTSATPFILGCETTDTDFGGILDSAQGGVTTPGLLTHGVNA